MGKKKNLNHREPDPMVKVPLGADRPIPSAVSNSFKENCFGNGAKSRLGIEPATQNGAHLNGVDPDPCAECPKPQSCHACPAPVSSSQTKAFERLLVNGTSSCDRTHVQSVNGLSEDSGNSFSSDPSETSKPSHCDANDGDVVVSSAASNVDEANTASHVTSTSTAADVDSEEDVTYVVYESELQMPEIMRLIQKDLSEPYSIYTYRYFIHNWPHLCFMVFITL